MARSSENRQPHKNRNAAHNAPASAMKPGKAASSQRPRDAEGRFTSKDAAK